MTAESKPPSNATEEQAPTTQEKKGWRQGWPPWLRQFPRLSFPEPNDSYQLLDMEAIEKFFAEENIDAEASARIRHDIQFMEHELLRLFRERDHEAKFQQNRYRLFQLAYIGLATVATLIGSLMALSLNSNPDMVPILGFAETVVALLTTYLASVSGREPPLPLWMSHRRRAENLRREYFRYLMDLEPYDQAEGYQREMLLSRRAAMINRGVMPEVNMGNNPE